MMVKTCISPGDVLQNENSTGHKSPARSLDIHLFSLGNMRMNKKEMSTCILANTKAMWMQERSLCLWLHAHDDWDFWMMQILLIISILMMGIWR